MKKVYRTWAARTLMLLAIFAVAAGAVACNDDDDDDESSDGTPATAASPTAGADDEDAAAVEKTIRDALAAWNGKDVDTLITFFTDKGLSESFGEGEDVPREEIIASLPEFIGEPAITIRELATEVSGETATSEVLWEEGNVLANVKFSLINEAGAWKMNGEEDLPTDVPAGTTEVNVDLNEFAFGLAETDIPADGGFAFTGNNVGAQPHHMVLAKIPVDADIQELLMAEEDVPGFEFIGGVDAIEPGAKASMTFLEPLDPGRYVLACFLPDTTEGEEGTPHAFKGMVKEFTIP